MSDERKAAEPVAIVIDDEEGGREAMALALDRAGIPTQAFDDARAALEFLQRTPTVRAVVTDLKMPGMDGLSFVKAVSARGIDVGIVLVTAYGTVETAVEAIKAGAEDYLTKPVDMYDLRRRVSKLLERRRLTAEVEDLRVRVDKQFGFHSIVGHSPVIEKLFDRMRVVAPTKSTVLMLGESGTGKELVAGALHQNSPRRNHRFVALNCGAIPRELLESELFGHERGAFTGAHARQVGKIEAAHEGTLFLDEIAELSPELQVKLLRVLEERTITPVGAHEPRAIDFRLLAATNKHLETLVRDGKFREDLYFRLKVVTLDIPPLRERRDDIPLLVEHFLRKFEPEYGKTGLEVTPAAMRLLVEYSWPGNVRELRNVIENLAIFSTQGRIDRDDLPAEVRIGASPVLASASSVVSDAAMTMAEIEKQAILRTLQRTGGRRAEAANILGIGLRTLQRKLKEYKMAPSDEGEDEVDDDESEG